jgi:hypothetical protein
MHGTGTESLKNHGDMVGLIFIVEKKARACKGLLGHARPQPGSAG